MAETSPKPGIRTTEFWSMLVTNIVITVFMLWRGFSPDTAPTSDFEESLIQALGGIFDAIAPIFGSGVMGVLALGYVKSRADIKKNGGN